MYNLSYRGVKRFLCLIPVERASGFIESREILGSDRYKYPGRSLG